MKGYELLQTAGFKYIWEAISAVCNSEARTRSENIPVDLQDVFYHRLRYRYQEFLYLGFLYAMEWEPFAKTHHQVWFNRIFIRESIKFFKDVDKYQEKFKENIGETITRARAGEDKAICRLVSWDKAFLGYDFIISHITHKQYNNDTFFFERLGAIIQRKSICKNKIMGSKHGTLLQFIRFCLVESQPIEDSYEEPTFTVDLSNLHKQLDLLGAFDGENDIVPTGDREYFMKLVRRKPEIKE